MDWQTRSHTALPRHQRISIQAVPLHQLVVKVAPMATAAMLWPAAQVLEAEQHQVLQLPARDLLQALQYMQRVMAAWAVLAHHGVSQHM